MLCCLYLSTRLFPKFFTPRAVTTTPQLLAHRWMSSCQKERGFVHRENLHNFTWTRSNGNRFSPNRLMINSLGTSNEGKKESTLPNIKFSHRLLWSFPVESESWEEHFENIQPSLTKSYFHCPSCPHEFYIIPIIRPAQKESPCSTNPITNFQRPSKMCSIRYDRPLPISQEIWCISKE